MPRAADLRPQHDLGGAADAGARGHRDCSPSTKSPVPVWVFTPRPFTRATPWSEVTRLLDFTPRPCAASHETVKRSDLAGHARCGRCTSHSRFFWAFQLYLLGTPDCI